MLFKIEVTYKATDFTDEDGTRNKDYYTECPTEYEALEFALKIGYYELSLHQSERGAEVS